MDRLPPPLAFLFLLFSGWINRQQQDVIEYLLEENRCSFADTERSLENVALRQQLTVLRRTVRVRTSAQRSSFGSCSLRPGRIGERRWLSCSPTRSCVGIASGFGAVGPNAPLEHVPDVRAHLRPFGHSSTR